MGEEMMEQLPEVSDGDLYHRYQILRFFEFEHLGRRPKEVSRAFHSLAWASARNLPYNAETSTCLRKLLEAKDCAVRASLPEETDE